jgi:hypothetical protein
MSIQDVVHELIEVVAGRHAVLTPAEADLLHEAVDQVEAKPQQAADEAELSQEPTGDQAPPSAPDAPANPAGDFSAPQGSL